MKNESILVFPTKILHDIGYFQGLNFNFSEYLGTILTQNVCTFMDRQEAEHDPNFKQIIPYIIMTSDNKLLYYVRGKRTGEERLVLNGSIGVGGHISNIDDSLFIDTSSGLSAIYNAAVEREVNEEIMVDCHYIDNKVAILNDDSNDVGKVHFGVIHLWELQSINVKKKENNITRLSFMPPDMIRKQNNALENWSNICLNNWDRIMQRGGI